MRNPLKYRASTLGTVFTALAALSLVVFGGCRPGEGGPDAEEPLEIEDVGGSIDAELSTEEDRHGPRWVDSGGVLPAGFPADLPLAAGSTIARTGVTDDGAQIVVFESRDGPAKLAADWTSLVEAEGWVVEPVSTTHFTLRKAGRSVRAILAPLGAGTRLRVVYR